MLFQSVILLRIGFYFELLFFLFLSLNPSLLLLLFCNITCFEFKFQLSDLILGIVQLIYKLADFKTFFTEDKIVVVNLFNTKSFFRIEDKHFSEQLDGHKRSVFWNKTQYFALIPILLVIVKCVLVIRQFTIGEHLIQHNSS